MDRQVSYNGPLSLSPLPCNFPSSRFSTLMNHPLLPNPPISMYFHTYAPPLRKPETALCDMAAQHIDHGKSIPVNNEQEGPSLHHHAAASSLGKFSSHDMESVIWSSDKDTVPEFQPDHFDAIDSIDNNNNDVPHPDTSIPWIWNCDAEKLEPSAAPRRADDGSCHEEPSSATSEVNETGPRSCERRLGDRDDADKYDNGPTKHLTDRSKGGFSETLGPKTLPTSGPLVDESQPSLSGCRSTEPVTETIMCSMPQISQSKYRNQRKLACTVLKYTEAAAPGGPRTRARARAEATRSFSGRSRARPFSDVEDELLLKLVGRKLAWKQIKEVFGQRFTGRNMKSLQGRWSRKLKFLAHPAKRIQDEQRRRSSS
ncbi:hypothetical protein BDV12DRAFT_25334 [Aspergillus spectabilis]